jgi:hypothetical protein
MTQPSIYTTAFTESYFKKILQYHNVDFYGETQFKVNGFDQYNWLVDINQCFSTTPSGDINDRTSTVRHPWKMYQDRPWVIPTDVSLSLDQCFERRVKELTNTNQKLNLMWSGGIDSTSMLVGFLNHCNNLSQIRILYSTASIKENPFFYLLLEKNQSIELIDFGGDTYLDQNFDGIFISADGADDITASLDSSFIEEVGYKGLYQPWQDLFFKKSKNVEFVNFCEWYFQTSGRDITTVLEAKWWFYTGCKIQKFPRRQIGLLQENQPFVIGFFDCYEFEHYTFFNTDLIIPNKNYSSYKQFLKDYIYKYDQNNDYYTRKEKENSTQTSLYKKKKMILQSTQYIMILSDGTRIKTDNLPFLSEYEYRKKYSNSLDYLFNTI